MDFVPQLTWGNLPQPALIAMFKNMPVSNLISSIYSHDPVANQYWLSIATSNEVWEKRYLELAFQPEVSKLANYFTIVNTSRHLQRHIVPEISIISLLELYRLTLAIKRGRPKTYLPTYERRGPLFPGQEEKRKKIYIDHNHAPRGYYFAHFMLIWSIFPHCWRDNNGVWLNLEFKVPKLNDGQSADEVLNKLEFYRSFLKLVKFEDRLIWIEASSWTKSFWKSWMDAYSKSEQDEFSEVAPYIRHSNVPKGFISLSTNPELPEFSAERYIQILVKKVNGIWKIQDDNIEIIDATGDQVLPLQPPQLIIFHDTRPTDPTLDQGKLMEQEYAIWAFHKRITNGPGGWSTPDDDFFRYEGPLQIWFHQKERSDLLKNPDLMQCSICTIPTLLICGKCQDKAYCSRECQRIDAKHGNHQHLCKSKK